MGFRHKPLIRIISLTVLLFFSWTFGGLFDIAYAATDNTKRSVAKSQQSAPIGPEAKLQKTLDDTLQILSDPSTDTDTKKNKLKTKKSDIDSIDVDVKKQFAATEKKLKDEGLPAEILDRHYKFVKHYEDNLRDLRNNFDAIDKAKDRASADSAVQKTKEFLEKVQPPKKKSHLDPNKLPHRSAEPVFKDPRTKPEEFLKNRDALAVNGKVLKDSKTSSRLTIHDSPLLVASNGSLTGLLSKNTEYTGEFMRNSSSSFPDLIGESRKALDASLHTAGMTTTDGGLPNGSYQIAMANPPTSADLAQTIEVQFTDAIKAKAAELNYNPVKIYNWVRNNVDYVPTYGSIQGADMCLQTKQCNDMDTASLLIALLRASGIHARYVYGTIEVPIERVKNWVGGFTDTMSALNLIASGGTPVKGISVGGELKYVQMEHVWTRALVDYTPSMGALHREGDTWIPLDASYKQYTYTKGVDLQASVPFDSQTFLNQIKSTATINEQEGYITNVSMALTQAALNEYNARLVNYVDTNMPNATVSNILGDRQIARKEQAIMPASLPYKVIVAGIETGEVTDRYRHKIVIELSNDFSTGAVLSYTASLPQVAGKRITISYEPATAAEKAVIDSYATQYATDLPAYLIHLKPVLKIENVLAASGATLGMGNAQKLSVTINSPSNMEVVTHNLLAGDYAALGLNPGRISLQALQNRIDKNDFSEPVGEMLHQVALSYWAENDSFNNILSKIFQVAALRLPSELLTTSQVSVSYLFDVPRLAAYRNRNIDVGCNYQMVMSFSADTRKAVDYVQHSGMTSSFLEGVVFDQLFGNNIGDSVSAVTALKTANDQGIPIYHIDSNNIATALPNLQVSVEIKDEILNAVNQGLSVEISKTNITQMEWTGIGYIILNPINGSGSYKISRGSNGGDSDTGTSSVIPLPQAPLTGPESLIIGSLATNVGTVLTTEAGVVTGVAIVLDVELMMVLLLLLIIFELLRRIAEKYPPRPPSWERYRHYTNYAGLAGIIKSNFIGISDDGDLGPGAYLTDLFEDPQLPGNAAIIANILRMSESNVKTYLDIEIDRNRILLLSNPVKYPHQYVYPFVPILLDGRQAQIVGEGPAGP